MINTKRRGQNWVLSNDTTDEIARGSIVGMTDFEGFGERPNIQILNDTFIDVWEGTKAYQAIPNQVGGEQVMLFSSDPSDRITGTHYNYNVGTVSVIGTASNNGIQKVEIDYLDATGNEKYETVTMNGTKWVKSVGTNIRFINAIHATQVGSQTVGIGTISITTSGTASTIYSVICSGGNMSLSPLRMVPFGKTFYLHEWVASCNNAPASVRLRVTTIHGTRTNNNIFLFTDSAFLVTGVYNKDFHIPKKIPALSMIKASVYPVSAGANVSVSYSGSLEDNNS